MADDAQPDDRDESFFFDGLSRFGSAARDGESRPLPPETDEFVFVRELGRGGMGVVYEALEKDGGRRVAVKVVTPDLRLSEETLQRFERESRSAAALVHRNCVFVYGAHRVQNSPAISMELLDETLEDRLRADEKISTAQALKWADEVLRGLEAAHAIGLVHRDVKPSNVFLSSDGRAKIGDFGLTRRTGADLSLTTSGQFLGSPLYASPEQLRGKAVDLRSDVYSSGALLYALLAGRAPHPSTNIGDLIVRVTTEEPEALEDLRPDLPVGLDEVVMKALAKRPEDRHRDCAAFRRALAPFLGEGPRVASLAYRFGAMMLDMIVLLAIDGVLGLLPGRWADASSFVAFLAYFGILEGRRGCSLGKLAMGLRVTTETGQAPGLLRAAGRALCFQLRRPLLLVLPATIAAIVAQVWLLALFAFARRRNGFRGLHEFLTGTRVVSVARARTTSAGRLRLESSGRRAASTPAIGRFEVRAVVAATPRGEILAARDPRLDRRVWIHRAKESGSGELPDLGELRRLEGLTLDGRRHDIYEDPGGAPLGEYLASGTHPGWAEAREALVHLLAESGGEPPALDRLLVDQDGHLRILTCELDFAEAPTLADDPEADRMGVILRALLGSERPAEWPAEVPDEAAALLRRLLAARTAKDRMAIGRALGAVTALAPGLSRGRRALQLLLGALPFALHARDLLSRLGDAESVQEIGRAALLNGLFSLGAVVLPLAGLAFALRDGPGFRLLGLRLVDEAGRRVSRGRAAFRSLLTWAPLPLASLIGPALQALGLGAEAVFVVTAIVLFGYLFIAIVNLLRPYAGVQDVVLGTTIERRPRA